MKIQVYSTADINEKTDACYRLKDLQKEINNFIKKVKVIDIRHITGNEGNRNILRHYFTILYEE